MILACSMRIFFVNNSPHLVVTKKRKEKKKGMTEGCKCLSPVLDFQLLYSNRAYISYELLSVVMCIIKKKKKIEKVQTGVTKVTLNDCVSLKDVKQITKLW